ncbi:hypothetical protein [Streptomyces hirsutus]|uniref:hypothetical protein n=1 Tax=Streptomyces hirsutus TaxID=35620 RepID=UPI00332CF1FF
MTDIQKTARAAHPLYTEESARVWHDFIAERLADDLREQYGTADRGPGVGEYREKLREAQAKHQRFADAWHSGDPDRIENGWWGLKNIAGKWRTHPDFPEPISDGTLPCPIPSPDTGHPCVKPVHPGWTPSEGHGGGHFWQSPKVTELEKAGVHRDYRALLSGQPAKYHLPENCTPDCPQWRDR